MHFLESCPAVWLLGPNLEPVVQSEISQKEKNQVSYLNASMWNLEKWSWWTYLWSRNRDTDVEKGLWAQPGKKRVGQTQRVALKHTCGHAPDRELMGSCCVRQGTQLSAAWRPGVVGSGCEGGSGRSGYTYTHSWFTLYSRNQPNTAQQIIFQLQT